MTDGSLARTSELTPRTLPEGSCDCHFHIFEDTSVYPVSKTSTYIPALATEEEYKALCRKYGLERAVLVHPSVYGSDHTSYEDIMKRNTSWMRGVVVASSKTSDNDLERWNELGTRGTRINMLYAPTPSLQEIDMIIDKVKPFGWHIQVIVDLVREHDLMRRIVERGVSVVVDHLGHGPADQLIKSPGFANLCSLMKEGQAWVKLSAPYRLSQQAPRYPDVRPLVDTLLDANPERAVWGTDWPHPNFDGPALKETELIDLVFDWFSDTSLRKTVLVDNPTKLYWSA